MKKRYLILLILLSSSFANANPVNKGDGTLKSYWGWHLNVFYPRIAPAELGLGYNRMLKNNYSMTLNYRLVVADSKSGATDYKSFGLITFGDRKNFLETMHTFNFRMGKSFQVTKKLRWFVEAGPSYNLYHEIIVTPEVVFTYNSHLIEDNHYKMLGLSIRNSIALIDSRKIRLEAFLYHNINTRFSYTSFGFQLGNKRHTY